MDITGISNIKMRPMRPSTGGKLAMTLRRKGKAKAQPLARSGS